jgi:hypothetical protein
MTKFRFEEVVMIAIHPLRNLRDPSRSMVAIEADANRELFTLPEARALLRVLKDAIGEASEPLPAKPASDAAGA